MRRLPEAPHTVDIGRRESHVRRELVGEPADFSSAHRIRLTGQRERPRAWLADAAGGQVAVDDGVDLVGALRRLVDPLRVAVTTRGVARNKAKNAAMSCSARPVANASPQHCRQLRAPVQARRRSLRCGGRYSRGRARRCRRDAPAGRRTAPYRCRASAEEQIGVFAGDGAARIDHDDARAALRLFFSMRWNSTGWHQAALEPTSTSRSAWSRSS